MIPAPSLKRGFALYGASFGLTVAVSLLFIVIKSPSGLLNIPLLSAAISLFAVLLPTLVASYWPRDGAPNGLPPFKAVSPWVLGGAACWSLPFYMVFAAIQIGLGRLFALHAETGLIEPLTANSPLAFAWIWLSIAMLPAFTEETLYRGFLQRSLVGRWGFPRGLLAAAALFSLAHLEPAGSVSRVLMGLWFGYLFYRTGSIWPGVVAHALNNTWGVAFANWNQPILAHMPTVAAAGALALLGGLTCFWRAGALPWSQPNGALPPADAQGPELPYFVQVSRPRPPEG